MKTTRNKIHEKLDAGLLSQDVVCRSQRQDVAIIYLEKWSLKLSKDAADYRKNYEIKECRDSPRGRYYPKESAQ